MHKRIIAAAAAASVALAAALPLIAGEDRVVVTDPYARETPPGARVGGVYMTLTNHGAANRLVGARSDAAPAVQIHNHTMDEAGVMRMREVEGGLPLGMHESVVLAPGGLHIMLMGLESRLEKGEAVDLTLEFEDGSTMDVSVPVVAISATGPANPGTKHDRGGKMRHDH